jgi:hypothetical protein
MLIEAEIQQIISDVEGPLVDSSTMTEAQSRYVQAERQLAAIEQLIKPLRELHETAFDHVIRESEVEGTRIPEYFQDGFGVVHKIAPRQWMSVKVRPFEIAHTRRPEFGEAKGSLSEKEAKEAGFEPVINKVEGLI